MTVSTIRPAAFVCVGLSSLVLVGAVAAAPIPKPPMVGDKSDGAAAAEDEEPPWLRYDWPEGQELTYDLKMAVEAEDLGVTHSGTFTLKCLARKDDRLKLQYQGTLRETKSRAQQVPDDPLERHRAMMSRLRGPGLGPASFQGSGPVTNVIWMDEQGHVGEREGESSLPLIMDHASDLTFEPLPDSPRRSWQVGMRILVGLPGKERPRPSFPSPLFAPREEPPTRQITLVADQAYEILRVEGDTVVVQKQYSLTPPDSEIGREIPKITGSGLWKFNRKLNASESLDFDQKVVFTKGSLTLTVPVKVTYRLVPETELTQRREAERQREEEARKKAAEALAKRPPPPASGTTPPPAPLTRPPMSDGEVQHFKHLLEHASVQMREMVIPDMAARATPAAVPTLIKALEDESPVVRSAVLQALARLKPPEAAEAIARRLRHEQDRSLAVQALKQIGPSAVAAVLPYLDDEVSAIRLEACRILAAGKGDRKQTLTALQKTAALLEHKDQKIAAAAVPVLGDLASALAEPAEQKPASEPEVPDRVLAVLGYGLAASDAGIRLWSARLAGELGPRAASLAAKLTKAAADADLDVRQAAAAALQLIAPGQTEAKQPAGKEAEKPAAAARPETEVPARLLDVWKGRMGDQDAAVRYWSVFLVARLGAGARPAMPAIVECCADEQAQVRYAAARAVKGWAASRAAAEPPAAAQVLKLAEQINALPSGSYDQAAKLEGDLPASLTRLWPVQADRDSTFGSRGRQSTTGPNSAEWFGYGGAGNWRVFAVQPNRKILLRARGDEQAGTANMLGDIQFTLAEYENGSWVVKETVTGPTNFFGLRYFIFTPASDRIRIEAKGWFYCYVYQL